MTSIEFYVQGGYFYIAGNMHPDEVENIVDEFKFEKPNSHYILKQTNDINKCYHNLFYPSKKLNIVGAGAVELWHSVYHFIKKQYPQYNIRVIHRLNLRYSSYKAKIKYLDYNVHQFKLRDYQTEAVETFMMKKRGVLEIATGGGKTVIGAEIIKRCDTRTIWMIDRKELLVQTQEQLLKYLGIEFVTATGDKIFNALKSDFVILPVQSLYRHLELIKKFKLLDKFNLVIVDEFHKSAAKSYSDVLGSINNTTYRLGLTGTAFRDDGMDPVMFAGLGEVIYSKPAIELSQEGRLILPTVRFLRYDIEENFDIEDEEEYKKIKYPEDYRYTIYQKDRMNKIIDICIVQHCEDKILILTKEIEHGKLIAETIAEYIKFHKRDVFHIHGSVSDKERLQVFSNWKESKNDICIYTLSIASEGLDIPDLDVVINASANKGDVKTIQIIGRVLRKIENKDNAYYYDFDDMGKYTRKHTLERLRALKEQGYTVRFK